MTRVGITTTADGYPRLAGAAERHGLVPVPLPCIEVVAAPVEVLALAREEARRADWLLITSARTVTTLWPEGGMPSVPVAAVGSASAAAVENAGGTVGFVGESGGEDLVFELSEKWHEANVFFPHASGARQGTVECLEDVAADMAALPVYETSPVAPGLDAVDAVVFGSPSAVRGWALARGFDDLVLAAIGETTAAALAELAREPDVVPSRPDFELLMALLAHHLRQRSPV